VNPWAKAAMREPMPNNRAAMRINYEVLALMNVVEEGLEKVSYQLPAECMAQATDHRLDDCGGNEE
jgi:hypothetical protein